MSAFENRRWKLIKRPEGAARRSDFVFETVPAPEPQPGEVLVEVEYLSLDPAMRGWMNEGKSYVPPVALGEVMRALGAGRVVASNDPALAVGDTVTGVTGVQAFAVAKAKTFNQIDARLAPLPRWLGVLGMPGMTAYFGLLDVGQPKPGQTVVVSGAAGAVGSAVGQIAKIQGCRAIGIAGGADKCAQLRELGFDAAIDYKQEDVRAALARACPNGIDVYFDNVGGEILDVALGQLALHARVVICGAISQYGNLHAARGPKNYLSLLVNRARMEGFVVTDFLPRWSEGVRQMATWLAEGRLTPREQVEAGLERFPEVLDLLFTGGNTGKLVLKV